MLNKKTGHKLKTDKKMFGKASNVKLIVLLAVLLGVYLGIEFFGGKSRSSTFREVLVDYDNEKVDKVVLKKKGGEETILKKEGDNWKVLLSDKNKTVNASSDKVKGLLNSLKDIKPSRIIAKSESKWKEYEVTDSLATRAMVYVNGDKAVDIYLGKFNFNNSGNQNQFGNPYARQQQQYYTAVRLKKDNEVYASDNFMSMSISTDASSYRNSKLLDIKKDSVKQISFVYPADSSFVLEKSEGKWMIDNVAADSSSVAKYLQTLGYTNGSNFEDEVSKNSLGKETYTLLIKEAGKSEPVEIKAYSNSDKKWIINSSFNEESLFSDEQERIVQKLFKGKDHFLKTKS